jgi:diguanylate cyclase (GGDEF)-like protein
MKTEQRVDDLSAVLSLRWLLAILASYLTLFSYLGTDLFPFVSGVAVAFSLTNVGLMLVPRRHFIESKAHKVIAVFDVIFISTTLYLLRVPENHLYLGFIVIFVLTVVWRDFRLVRFSLLVVSLLFGVFRYFRLFQSQLDVNIERFLTLSLFFVVSIFYIFLSDLLRREAKRSNAMVEENRIAEVMVEMSRALSSSLNSSEVLYSIVSRLRGALDAEDCSIVRIDPKTGLAKIMVRASRPEERDTDINLEANPELQEAYRSRRILYRPADPHGLIVIPMVAEELVLGLIDIRSPKLSPASAAANTRFFEITASTAANALRNAQLFEEVEHRARTDFLTGLANHRFFQTTLSTELVRAQRHNHPLSLLIIDLDFLKEVNDRFGHPSGDLVIRAIAETIRTTLREIDFAARYGGEEFTAILPETALPDAVQVADRIRERIAAQQFSEIGSITASIGISNYPVNALSKEDLIRVADQALYVAKNGGRDRVAYFNYQMITR